MRMSSSGFGQQQTQEGGEKRCLNSELWHACAGPLVSLPALGSRVVYFPQGHSEQVAASTNKEIESHIPNYPSLPPQLICQLHNVTMHADAETDEVYAQMTLQPLSPQEQKDPFLPVELGCPSKQPTNYFCKTLTASDTSTHGGFSVPRRAAEKVFPPLDFSQQPPAQELIAGDLHGNEWKFRHIFRGQPKRHLLTTGWSVFVSAKKLVAGDSVLFIWNEKNQLLLGIRHSSRPQTVMPSSVLSSDSMHIGLLAAAAHAAATNSRFTIFYNPRASPTEFVIPLTKYAKAVYHTRVSVGMRFRMLFETEESSVRRYMGTITGISDLDPTRWPNSHWRSVKVGWDESTAGERQPRVSLWEIEPLTTFPMYPPSFPLRLKRPWPAGLPNPLGGRDDDMGLNSPLMWYRGDKGMESLNFQGIGATPWIQPRLDASLLGLQPDMYQAMAAAALQEMRTMDPSKQAAESLLQFSQSQNVPGSALMQGQMLQSSQSQRNFVHGIQESQFHTQAQMQALLQQQLLQSRSFNDQQQQHQQQQQQQQQHQQQQHQQQQNQQQQHQQQQHQQQQQQHQQQQQQPQYQQQQQQKQQQFTAPQQQIPNIVSSMSHLVTAPQSQAASIQTVRSVCQQPNYSGFVGNPVAASSLSPLHSLFGSYSQTEASQLLNLPISNTLAPPAATWLPRQPPVEPLVPSGAITQGVLPQVDQLEIQQGNTLHRTLSLQPFSDRDSSVDQEGSTDPQNNLLFGVNIDSSSLLMHNGMSSLGGVGSECESTNVPFAAANFLSATNADYPLNPDMTPSSCIDESDFLPSPENGVQGNSATRTFVKVHKSGSFGRSLDITSFSSYTELRSELASMFGLEGQLEDPLRSGWQLVFVDRENDVLLLGDDPWQEFVDSVWCIKILSPQEVHQLGKQGLEVLSLAQNSVQKLTSGNCDEHVSRQNPRNTSSGITAVGSLDY